jgi:hypothetical protein
MAANKPDAKLLTLIFFVMLSIGLGVTTYMFHREFTSATKAADQAKAENQKSLASLKNALNDIEVLKSLVGHKFETVEDPANPANPATVAGAMRDDLAKLGGPLAQPTYTTTLMRLRDELDTTIAARDKIQTTQDKEHKDLLALQKQYQDRTDKHDDAKTKAEGDLRGQIAKTAESISAKEKEINRLRNDFNQIQLELEQEKDLHTKDLKQKNDEIKRMSVLNARLSEELDTVKKVSFEVPDGTIRMIDGNARLVYLDIGSRDFLRERTTFSVYDKSGAGVGRGPEDIKGKIEVTRIIKSDLAEAKIIDEDLYRPIGPGDLIYTPLWSPGRTERFAFVGVIDLDGDGKSDRDLLREVLAQSGAKIDTEVDDNGERTGNRISEATKYLVIGEIPEAGAAALEEERKRFEAVAEQLKDLRNEAREHGVRILPLNEFLGQIGYKTKRRLFIPGQERPYNLRAGAASSTVGGPIKAQEAAGQVSGVINKRKAKLQPPVSSGQTSKLFGQ